MHPSEEILGHVEDISAAYHWILYHPLIAIMYAQVFEEFLMIPVGLIFGGQSSPSDYMQPGEQHAHLATVSDFRLITTDLAKKVTLPTVLTLQERHQLTQAMTDIHDGKMHEQQSFFNASFVDDNTTAAWADKIKQALQQSMLSAYIMFRFPAEDRHPPVFDMKNGRLSQVTSSNIWDTLSTLDSYSSSGH
jgi:hypothetical protein